MDQPAPTPPAPHAPSERRLVRPVQGRAVAGVAAGLGAFLGVDPRIVRLLFLAALLFGGLGLALYVVGWVALPSAGAAESPAERGLRRLRNAPTGVQAAAVVLAVLLFAGQMGVGNGGLGWAILLIAAGFVLFRQDTRAQQRPAGLLPPPPPSGPVAPPPPGPVAPAAPPASRLVGPPGPAPVASPGSRPVAPPLPPLPPRPLVQPGVGAYGSYGVPPVPPPRPPRPPRRPSYLGRITLGATLLVLGGAVLMDTVGLVDVLPVGYAALALGTVGGGLIVGARAGRARWLIAVGLLLVPPLLVTAFEQTAVGSRAVDLADRIPRTAEFGDVRHAPVRPVELEGGYSLAVGRMVLDLTRLSLSDPPTRVSAEVGVGELEVVVPADARVELTGTLGAGAVRALGAGTADAEDLDLSTLSIDRGPEDGSRLVLDLEVGAGQVEVRRATPRAPAREEPS